ncbi:MAG TPA: hypothetical protein VLV16_12025 [Gemmatimonadales bacterium]|nr:hypothetical protein [Gemmatimonadales bacterium]
MIRQFCWSAAALLLLVSTAAAQGAVGSWNGKTMIGAKDSVVATYVLTIAADGKSGTMTFPNHDPIELRVLAMGGDSLVTEAGPYPSVLRPGQTVKSLRNVARVKGNTMTGMFQATYENGDVVKGKTQATRAK